MFKPIISLISVALLAFSSNVYAEANAEDFHFKASLTAGSESLQSVELPWSVMSNLLQKNQQDLRVYNAEQQAVPFAVRYLSVNQQAEQQTRTLNFFPMGDIEKLGTILEKEASNGRYKMIKLIKTGQRYLIIDNPRLDDSQRRLPLQSLTLDWQNLRHWLPKSLKVEVSNNLSQWKTVGIEALPYRLSEGGTALENKVLSFKAPITQRFIRLSGGEDFNPLLESLKNVSALYRQVRVANDLNWNAVKLQATEQTHQFQYAVLPSLPVQQWRFHDLAAGSLYKGKFSARYEHYAAEKNASWGSRRSFSQYTLQTEAGLIRSKDVNAKHLSRTDAWRFDFDQLINGDSPPKLALGWKPMEVVFVAQGNGPFELRYGSRSAAVVSRLSLDGVLGQVKPEKISIKETLQLSTVEKEKDGSLYKYLLWGLLAAAVLMLIFMAKGLLRDMES